MSGAAVPDAAPAGLPHDDPLVTLLADLVRIPSPAPPGDTRAIAAFLRERLAPSGAAVAVLAPPEKPEAASVVATLGDGGAPVVMLHAHIDTVPVADDEAERWSRDPHRPWIENGRLYGKGAVDDKAPLAAMVAAFEAAAGRPLRGTLLLVGAAEEEVGGTLGTRWLAERGHLPACDFAVVGEQTGNRIALAHKGVLRATVRTRGRSVHATNPDRGVNAIVAMARIVDALHEHHLQLRGRSHPLVGHPTCNVGVIRGGSTANAVPDRCEVMLDRRMIPGEDPAAVRRELQAVVAAVDVGDASAELDDFLVSSWFDSELATPLGTAFQQTVDEVHGAPSPPVGYLPGSDAKHLMALKRGDMVVFGPGSYEVAHAADEFVDLDELERCRAILDRFLGRVLTAGGAR